MALFNPVYAFVVPFLLLVTVPLAVFAGITTTIAFSALILRVVAVYLDVALSLVPHYLGGRKTPYPSAAYSARQHGLDPPGPFHQPQHHQYHRRSTPPRRTDAPGTSASSLSSVSSAASSHSSLRRRRLRRSSSALSTSGSLHCAIVDVDKLPQVGAGLAPSIGPARDFEGVGGWRLGGEDDEWDNVNSRLELPDRQYHGRGASASGSGSGNGHFRSPSGPTTPGEGGVLMMKGRNTSPSTKRPSTSPNSSRTRTPSGPRIALTPKNHADSYFPSLTSSTKSAKKVAPTTAVDT